MNEKWLFILDEEELRKCMIADFILEGGMDLTVKEKPQKNVGLLFALEQEQLVYWQRLK